MLLLILKKEALLVFLNGALVYSWPKNFMLRFISWLDVKNQLDVFQYIEPGYEPHTA